MTTPKAKTPRKPRVAKVVSEQFTTKTPAATEISLTTTPMIEPLMLTTPEVPPTISFVNVVEDVAPVVPVVPVVPQNEWHEIIFIIPDPNQVAATTKAWLTATSELQRIILGFGKLNEVLRDDRWALRVDNAALERLRAKKYDKLPERLR